jgi:hypothetical protein
VTLYGQHVPLEKPAEEASRGAPAATAHRLRIFDSFPVTEGRDGEAAERR